MTAISKPPDSKYWRQLYRAALFEIDDSKLPGRIAEAEKVEVKGISKRRKRPYVLQVQDAWRILDEWFSHIKQWF